MEFIKKLLMNNKMLSSLIILYYLLILLFMILTWSLRDSFVEYSTKELTQASPWYELFLQNASASILIILLGIISFAMISIFVSLYNLFTFAVAIDRAYEISESFFYSFFVIITHGILEIFAIAISLYVSTFSLRLLINTMYKRKIFKVQTTKGNLKLIVLMLTLFFFGSIIESYVTPFISKMFV